MNSTASNDLDLVEELGKTIGEKLEPVDAETIKRNETVGYVIDEKECVTGLALDRIGLKVVLTI